MLFPTVEFAIFFSIVFVISWALMRHRTPWKLFILAASYVFYAFWDLRFLALLVGFTVVSHVAGMVIGRSSKQRVRKWFLIGALVFDLGLLGWFKFYGFFATSLMDLFRTVGVELPLPLVQVILPVGISFTAFRMISYVVDIYRGKLEPPSLLDLAVYVGFFPYLAAGPITRGSEFLPQLITPRDSRSIDASRAFALIAGGLVKKVIIAEYLSAHLVNGVFATPMQFSSLEVLFGIYGYAVQIYCDFSAYSDIAIGVALLLGFELPDNFDRPYAAESLQQFWRRWHITLSNWLRDYLYIPLGGNRKGQGRTYVNLVVTMVLGGLWHGAAWHFVVWGALHGAWLAVERFVRGLVGARGKHAGTPASPPVWRRALAAFVTFQFVSVAWVFFRADTVGDAFTILGRVFTAWGAAPAVTPLFVAVVMGAIAVQYVPRGIGERLRTGFSRLAPVAQAGLLSIVLLAVNVLGPEGQAAFIYFGF